MNRASNFSEVVDLALVRTDTWYVLWLLFLVVATAVAYSAHSRRIEQRSLVGSSIAFLMLSGVLAAWLNAVFVQLSALYGYAGAMISTADATASSREAVEIALERLDQAALVDAIEPPPRAIWLAAYCVVVVGVFCFLLVSYRRTGTKQPNNAMHATCENARA